MGSAAQANPGFSGLAAQVEPVEKKTENYGICRPGQIRWENWSLPPRLSFTMIRVFSARQFLVLKGKNALGVCRSGWIRWPLFF